MVVVHYTLLDVFTDAQFEGNPLAVVIDPPSLTDDVMQRIAAEFNLSETIFLEPAGAQTWRTRIFTPSVELPFTGHPTVGAAIALAQHGHVDRDGDHGSIVLAERAGDVDVEFAFANDEVVSARFGPPEAPHALRSLTAAETTDLLRAVGLAPDDAHPDLGAGEWSAGLPFSIVPLASVEALGRARPAAVDPFVYLVAPGSAEPHHWRARMFAGSGGVAEDPATGAAACAFAGLLSTIAPDGDIEWLVEQGVEMGRRSVLHVSATVRGGEAVDAKLGGSAVAVGGGELRLS